MLIGQSLNDAINAQVGREFGASMQYIQIATYFDSLALEKVAEFFYKQADEERDHAMKFVKYITEAGGNVHIPPIDAPKSSFESPEEAAALALQWELDVTQQIHGLMEIALKEKDYIARQFLDWFENEQLEEVSTMDKVLRVVKGSGHALYMLEAYFSHM